MLCHSTDYLTGWKKNREEEKVTQLLVTDNQKQI